MQAKLLPTITANYLLWPVAHFVNFRFIPTEHRILYNNVISVCLPTPFTSHPVPTAHNPWLVGSTTIECIHWCVCLILVSRQ